MSREIFRRFNYFVEENPEDALLAMGNQFDEDMKDRGDYYLKLSDARITSDIQEIGAKAVDLAEHLLSYSANRTNTHSYFHEDLIEEGIVNTDSMGAFRVRKKQEVDPPQSSRYEMFIYNPLIEIQLEIGSYHKTLQVCSLESIDNMDGPDNAAELGVAFSALLAVANDRSYFWHQDKLTTPRE
jgi:hypothetical protein